MTWAADQFYIERLTVVIVVTLNDRPRTAVLTAVRLLDLSPTHGCVEFILGCLLYRISRGRKFFACAITRCVVPVFLVSSRIRTLLFWVIFFPFARTE